MKYDFYAYLNRMKYIERWGLMHNTQTENDLEHTMQVVFLSHAMAEIANVRFKANVDVGKISLIAAYHDISEVITGDLATPVKYANPEIKDAFHNVEDIAVEKLQRMLPADLQENYDPYLKPDTESREYKIVKAADKVSAYIKCVEELKFGNTEFTKAKDSIKKQLEEIELPELKAFMEDFGNSFELTLDELG